MHYPNNSTSQDVIMQRSSVNAFHGASPTSWFIGNTLMKNILKQNKDGRDPMEPTKQSFSLESSRQTFTNYKKTVPSPKQPYSGLHVAACLGQSVSARELLENGTDLVDIDEQDHNGNTPLMWAASEGSEEIVQILIDNGAKVNFQNYSGESALFLAASRGYQNICEILILSGADLNLGNIDELTPCHSAVIHNQLIVLKTLVSYGAHVNAQDCEGDTPLHCAVREGQQKAVETLIVDCKARASVNVRNDDQETPLELASCLSETWMVDFLSHFAKEEEHEGTPMLF